jgi:hypothetical protein
MVSHELGAGRNVHHPERGMQWLACGVESVMEGNQRVLQRDNFLPLTMRLLSILTSPAGPSLTYLIAQEVTIGRGCCYRKKRIRPLCASLRSSERG